MTTTTSSKKKTPAARSKTSAPSGAKSASPRKKAKAARAKASPASKKSRRDSTRTSSRSAKRRSPKKVSGGSADQIEYERLEFLRAMDTYKRKTGKTFPNWSEVLEVLRNLGWMHPLRLRGLLDQSRPRSS